MSPALSDELENASDEAPLVSDPESIPGLIDRWTNYYNESLLECKKGKNHVKNCRKAILLALGTVAIIVAWIAMTSERGSGILVFERSIPYWIITLITAATAYLIVRVTIFARNRASRRARESLVRLVGLYYKNADYIEYDYHHGYIVKNAIKALDPDPNYNFKFVPVD